MNSDLASSKKKPYEQEFSVRVPKNSHKKHCVMRFKEDSGVKFREWKNIKLERENNSRDRTIAEQEIPKFGAGSEFGREAREEARKKKYGIIDKKYKSENQPWILQVNGKSGKKFKGVQQGGFGQNVAYYVFIQTIDESIEAYPLDEWYNFQPIQTYKTLTAEEAEEVMNQKSKIIDYSNIMIKKRLRCKDEDDEVEEDLMGNKKNKKQSKKIKDFKISDMEDWIDSDENSDSGDDKEDKSETGNHSKEKKKNITKKKKKNDLANEAFEDSDDGDGEGRELDYISDSSASESELEQQKEMKSVAEEHALKKLLASDEDEESDSDSESDKKKNEIDEKSKNNDNENKNEPNANKESPNSLSNIKLKQDLHKSKDDKKPLNAHNINTIASTAPSTSSLSLKRKCDGPQDVLQDKKRIKVQDKSKLSPSGLSDLKVITKDTVTRYLMRKPMTVIELLQKFRPQIKASHSKDEIALRVTKIIRDINPTTQNLNGKLYFSVEK